jgi:hypothetical protein
MIHLWRTGLLWLALTTPALAADSITTTSAGSPASAESTRLLTVVSVDLAALCAALGGDVVHLFPGARVTTTRELPLVDNLRVSDNRR